MGSPAIGWHVNWRGEIVLGLNKSAHAVVNCTYCIELCVRGLLWSPSRSFFAD
jgi:hypothetical protein